MRLRGSLKNLELLQEEAEPRHDEAKSHQGKTGAYPCKKRPFSRQVISHVGSLAHFLLRIHLPLRAAEYFEDSF